MYGISEIQWTSELNKYGTTDEMCSFLMTNLNKLFNSCFPIVTISRKRQKDKPWITSETRKAIQNKNRLYRKYIKNPSIYENIYNETKRAVEKEIIDSEAKYYKDILNKKINSVKTIWQEFGPILGKNKSKRYAISKLKYDGNFVTDPKNIADAFNKNFCEIGPTLASKIPDGNLNYKSYMGSSNHATFFLKPLVISDVLEELLKINHNKCAGPDNFSPRLIKSCAYVLSEPLTTVYSI